MQKYLDLVVIFIDQNNPFSSTNKELSDGIKKEIMWMEKESLERSLIHYDNKLRVLL